MKSVLKWVHVGFVVMILAGCASVPLTDVQQHEAARWLVASSLCVDYHYVTARDNAYFLGAAKAHPGMNQERLHKEAAAEYDKGRLQFAYMAPDERRLICDKVNQGIAQIKGSRQRPGGTELAPLAQALQELGKAMRKSTAGLNQGVVKPPPVTFGERGQNQGENTAVIVNTPNGHEQVNCRTTGDTYYCW